MAVMHDDDVGRGASSRPDDRMPIVNGVLGVLAAALLSRLVGIDGRAAPVGLTLLPVLVVALLSTARATVVVASTALVAGSLVFLTTGAPVSSEVLRYLSFVASVVLVAALSEVRRRRDVRIGEQEMELALTRQTENTDRLLVPMLERLPELSGARDITDVARRACRIARETFGADIASYWQIEGDQCVLLVREPAGDPLPPLVQIPRRLMSGDPMLGGRSRTVWVDVDQLVVGDPRAGLFAQAGVVVGSSTAVRVDFAAVGYLALSWEHWRPAPDAAWREALDRLADQVALAKTVVRRRLAQQEVRELTDRLQASFLPTQVDTVPGCTVRLLYRPGTRQLLLGGDFIDVASSDSGGTAFLIGDVSGHGPEQAALAATLRAAWRGALSVSGSTIAERVIAMDTVVHERRPTPGLFVTMLTGELDEGMSTMQYICAGHPPPILLPEGQGTCLGGPPLGIVEPGIPREVVKVDLEGDEGVLLVTDGLFEGHVAPDDRARLGFDAFIEIVGQRRDVRAPDFLEALADDLEHRNGGPMPDDAAALLMLRRLPSPRGHG